MPTTTQIIGGGSDRSDDAAHLTGQINYKVIAEDLL